MPSRKASRSRSLPVTRMQKTGPISAITPPMLGTNAINPATSAHAGASGTRRISRPISHSTATQSASMETARHQFTSALPAVRRCCPGDGRPLIAGAKASTVGRCGFAYPTGCSGDSITGGCAGSYGTGDVGWSCGAGSSMPHVRLLRKRKTMDLRPLIRSARVNLAAIGVGALYGLTMRLLFSHQMLPPVAGNILATTVVVMAVAFLFGVPFTMGYVTVTARFHLDREANRAPPGVAYWIIFPWLPAIFAMLLAALFAWEGSICLLFAAPIMLIMASLGGISAGLSQRHRFRPAQLSAAALLPMLLVVLESKVPDPQNLRTVETAIPIHASAASVWQNITRVPAIIPAELPASWVRSVGFPRPVEATLSHEGVGGVRQASFTGGLVFTETIDHWDSLHDLSFSIHANT